MVIFNSYVKLPEGIVIVVTWTSWTSQQLLNRANLGRFFPSSNFQKKPGTSNSLPTPDTANLTVCLKIGYLVVGFNMFQPLWKIWVRQLGLLFPTYGKIKFMFQTTNQVLHEIHWLIIMFAHFTYKRGLFVGKNPIFRQTGTNSKRRHARNHANLF